jgi:phosphatidate cytidylyltransferase
MLGMRLAIGLPMVAGFVACLWLDEYLAPWFPFWLVTAAVVLGRAALELVGLLSATGVRPSGNTVFGGTMAIIVANWAPHVVAYLLQTPATSETAPFNFAWPSQVLSWPLWTFVAVVMFAFIAQSVQFDRPGGTMAAVAATVLAVAYIGLLSGFILQFRWLDHGVIPLAALVATAKGSDTGAYTLGRLAGRHKLWPRLSPNKTIEGAIGGLVFGVAAALLVFGAARWLFHVPTLGAAAAAGFGLVVGSAAQLGDLMESMIKRDCARKDASAILPGFGGVLDVLDSLLFAGPVAYGYWLLFGP